MNKIPYTLSEGATYILDKMMTTISPSMEESQIADFIRYEWGKYCSDIQTDVMGNVYASFGKKGKLNVGLVAHMDSVGIQITNILPCGMLQFRSIGLRPHVLLGQQMQIVTMRGIVNAVVGFDTTSQYGQPKGLVDDDLWLDIGVSNGEEAARIVSIGDVAVMKPVFTQLQDRSISGTSIDDRIGLFILTECMRVLSNTDLDIGLTYIGSTQEEIGLRGSMVIGGKHDIDVCFVVDVDYATDIPTPHENQMGSLRLSKGPGLQRKADTNPILMNIVRTVAEKFGIPYQITVGRFIYGGTDATSVQVQNSGVATVNISIPCRNMHSPAEVCHLTDVENAVRLLLSVIPKLNELDKNSFIPYGNRVYSLENNFGVSYL